jgi:hypothetical protein
MHLEVCSKTMAQPPCMQKRHAPATGQFLPKPPPLPCPCKHNVRHSIMDLQQASGPDVCLIRPAMNPGESHRSPCWSLYDHSKVTLSSFNGHSMVTLWSLYILEDVLLRSYATECNIKMRGMQVPPLALPRPVNQGTTSCSRTTW